MIEHLRGWEKPWNLSAGPDGRRNGLRLSVSIAASLSGLNSVITSMRPRITASRFVKALVERRSAVESEWPLVNDGGRTCRISGGKAIYRTLGVENIRQRRKAGTLVVRRRLLSLDYKK